MEIPIHNLSSPSSSSPPPPSSNSEEGPYSEHAALLTVENGRKVSLEMGNARSLNWSLSNVRKFLPALVVVLVVWNLSWGEELSPTSTRFLAVFSGLMVALITTSVELPVLVAASLCFLALSRNLACKTPEGYIECSACIVDQTCDGYKGALEAVLIGFQDEVVWLVFCAFAIGNAVEITGLGQRIALGLVNSLGSSVISTGYSIFLAVCGGAEMALGPFIPSNTARGGGVVAPVVLSLARSLNSFPNQNAAIGAYYVMVGAQANLLSASLYLTGAASNPIIKAKAAGILGVDFGWLEWFIGASVPTIVAAMFMPWLLWLLAKRPSISTPPDAMVLVERNKLRSISQQEMILIAVLGLCLIGWISSAWTGHDPTTIAFTGMLILLMSKVLSWNDISGNKQAWSTLFWLAGFISLAKQLNHLNIISYFGHKLSHLLVPSPYWSLVILGVIYFTSMFFFASITAHAVAFAGVFMQAALGAKLNPLAVVAILAYFTSLSACLTNFSTGSVAIYFAHGYVSRRLWYVTGIAMGIWYMFIHLSVGYAWWKLLGWA